MAIEEKKSLIRRLLAELNELNAKQMADVLNDDLQAQRDAKCAELFDAGLPRVGYVRLRVNGAPFRIVFPTYDAAVRAVRRMRDMVEPAVGILDPAAHEGDILCIDGTNVLAGRCVRHDVDGVLATLDENCEADLDIEIDDWVRATKGLIEDHGGKEVRGRVVRLKVLTDKNIPVDDKDDEDSIDSLRHTVTVAYQLSIGATDREIADTILERIAEKTKRVIGTSVSVEPFRRDDFANVAFVMFDTDEMSGLDRAVNVFIKNAKRHLSEPDADATKSASRERSPAPSNRIERGGGGGGVPPHRTRAGTGSVVPPHRHGSAAAAWPKDSDRS